MLSRSTAYAWRVTSLAAAFLFPWPSLAQTAGGYSAGPSKEAPEYETLVRGTLPSPPATQDRVFAGTRFWLLDPGRYEVETWWDHKFGPEGKSEGLLQLEIEIGLAPHIQLDLYQNFTVGDAGFNVEGNQIEIRYSFGSSYNAVPLNPVLYLEWHPRKNAQDRAEVRLLLGGDLPRQGLWAANLFAETNVDYFKAAGNEGADAEGGVTAAASFPLATALRIGAEVRGGVDQHGTSTFYPMLFVGPNVLLRAPSLGLKLTTTAFFGLMSRDPRVRILTIAGWAF
jgi:hypothetical protein